jgi:hypothetical protein
MAAVQTALTNFTIENIDVNSIKLLNKQSCLIYDSCRIKWAWDLDALKTFVEDVVSLIYWEFGNHLEAQLNSSNVVTMISH